MPGMMDPESACALNDAVKRRSLRSSNSCAISVSRLKIRTSSCPVNDSSMWPFTAPVCFHCSANSFCARTPIMPAITADNGSAMSATSASCHDTMNIMMVMPTTVSTDCTSCENACWSAC